MNSEFPVGKFCVTIIKLNVESLQLIVKASERRTRRSDARFLIATHVEAVLIIA